MAILAHVGRTYKLDGRGAVELARMGVILEEAKDISIALGDVGYPSQVENRKEIHDLGRKEYVAGLHDKLAAIAKFLGTNEWMAGSRLTFVDFYVYDLLDRQRLLFLPKHLNRFPTLIVYLNRMENLKGVKEYLNLRGNTPKWFSIF